MTEYLLMSVPVNSPQKTLRSITAFSIMLGIMQSCLRVLYGLFRL